jgi:hypothetical protein
MRRFAPALAIAALSILVAAAALAATTLRSHPYVRLGWSGTTQVEGLAGAQAHWSAWIVVPREWKATVAKSGAVRLRQPKGMCSYVVTVSSRVAVGPATTPAARVAAAIPATGRALHDQGQRNQTAWQVGKLAPGIRGQRSVRAGFGLTAPPGSAVWHDLVVSATATPDSECHSGHVHGTGRQIADALAAALTSARRG